MRLQTKADMKRLALYKIMLAAAAAAAASAFCACEDDPQPVSYAAPEVRFTSPSSDVISATVGDTVSFSATAVSGDKVSVSWYIDGTLVSSAWSFGYVFEAPGTFTVLFDAHNGGGSVTREYSVEVKDRLDISLSVGDSLSVHRLQLDLLKVAAIVRSGSGVTHQWSVDGEVLGHEAFFGSFALTEARSYEVSYKGCNEAGVFERTFTVIADERPLEISFSVNDETIALMANNSVSITANVLYGGSGLIQSWYVDDEPAADGSTFVRYFTSAGDYVIRYEAVNGKGESVSRAWKVSVTASGDLMDDFEDSSIGPWFNLGENSPGIHLVANPLPEGLNTSAQVLCDQVAGSGSTSGYFTLKASALLSEKGFDVSKYSGLRFKVYLGGNKYYPRIDYGGTKYAPVSAPKFQGEWETLEYKLPVGKFDNGKNIVFRMMYNESGSNISGYDESSNNRTVYIDDIEFFE